MRIMSGFFYIFLKTYFTYLIFSAFFVIMFSGGANLTTKIPFIHKSTFISEEITNV